MMRVGDHYSLQLENSINEISMELQKFMQL